MPPKQRDKQFETVGVAATDAPPAKRKKAQKAVPVEIPETAQHPTQADHHAAAPAQAIDARKQMPQTVENLHAPEFFATDAQSISLINGMISIAFASSRYDYSEQPSVLKNVVVSRVVMSPAGAQNLAVRLFNFLEQKGFAAVPKDPKLRQ